MRIGGGEHPPADIPPMMSALVDNQATKGNERRNAAPNETDLLPAADGAGMNEADAEAPVALMSPEYHIVYQGDFQMADCTVTTPIVASTRPKSLLVRIALPRIARLSDHKDVALDVSPRQVTMSIPGIYAPVSIRLPFECDHEKGRARFQPRDRTLTITLPVVPSAEELVAIKVSLFERRGWYNPLNGLLCRGLRLRPTLRRMLTRTAPSTLMLLVIMREATRPTSPWTRSRRILRVSLGS